MPVSPEKEKALQERMARLGVAESDLRESFVRSSGPGGQKVNKTSSCVQLVHLPTGLTVKCQRERSQAMNRFLARRELCERLEQRVLGAQSARLQEIERIRRQKRKRSRRQKARMLDEKRNHAKKKEQRARVEY